MYTFIFPPFLSPTLLSLLSLSLAPTFSIIRHLQSMQYLNLTVCYSVGLSLSLWLIQTRTPLTLSPNQCGSLAISSSHSCILMNAHPHPSLSHAPFSTQTLTLSLSLSHAQLHIFSPFPLYFWWNSLKSSLEWDKVGRDCLEREIARQLVRSERCEMRKTKKAAKDPEARQWKVEKPIYFHS